MHVYGNPSPLGTRGFLKRPFGLGFSIRNFKTFEVNRAKTLKNSNLVIFDPFSRCYGACLWRVKGSVCLTAESPQMAKGGTPGPKDPEKNSPYPQTEIERWGRVLRGFASTCRCCLQALAGDAAKQRQLKK